MNRIKGLVLTSLLFVVVSGAFPQAQQQSTAAPVAPLPMVKQLKKTVGLLTSYFTKNDAPFQAQGTCFFVVYPDDRAGKDRSFVYLVTNRHVVMPGIEDGHPYLVTSTTLRVNTKDTIVGPQEGALPMNPENHWYFPDDDSVDLAVFPWAPDSTKYDIETLPTAMFATSEDVEKDGVVEGDPVLFTGLFYQFPGVKKFQPIVREGVLAMMPDEPMETTLGKKGNLYLAEVHVFGGNSGSPLLINLGGIRNGKIFPGSQYKLLGVISGYYHEDTKMKLTIATTYEGVTEQNSGIAIVVPASELKKLLDSPPLEAARARYATKDKVGH